MTIYNVGVKTTMDIPDSVYREFKVKTAMNGETMRNATLAFMICHNANGESWFCGSTRPRWLFRRRQGHRGVREVI